MASHDRFKIKAIQDCLHQTFTWMGCYGAPTRKPTRLWSSEKWVTNLARTMKKDIAATKDSTEVVTVVVDMAGGKITGGSGLKATQEYPEAYGHAVAYEYNSALNTELMADTLVDDSSDSDYDDAPVNDTWPDLKLTGVGNLLNIKIDHMPYGF